MMTRILAVALIGGAAFAAQGSNTLMVCVSGDRVLRQREGTACPAGARTYELALEAVEAGGSAPDDDALKNQVAELKRKLDFLTARVDQMSRNPGDNSRSTGNSVVAPFEVISKTGKTLLRVVQSGDHQGGVITVLNSAGKEVAWVSGAAGGGFFKTQSASNYPEVSLGSVGSYGGLVIRDGASQFRASIFLENGKPGLSLRNENYIPFAAITQGASGGGLLELADAAGNAQMRAGVTSGGCGRVETFPERRSAGSVVGAPTSFIVGNCR